MPIELDGGTQYTEGQQLLALVVPLVILGLLYVGWRVGKSRGLKGSERREVAWVKRQLSAMQMPAITIPDRDAEDLEAYRPKLHALYGPDPPSQPTLRSRLGDALGFQTEEAPSITRLARGLGWEAIALLFLAGTVRVGASTLRDLFTGSDLTISGLVANISTAAGMLVDVVLLFPASNLVWGLLLTAVIYGYEWLYANAVVLALVLGAGAILIATLDNMTDEDVNPVLYRSRRAFLGGLVAMGAGVWALGTGVAVGGQLLGYETYGTAAGALVAFMALVAVLAWFVKDVLRRLWSAYDDLYETVSDLPVPAGGTDTRRALWAKRGLVASYLLSRKSFAALGIVLLPVMLVYLGQAVLSGALFAIVGALLAASLLVKVAAVVIVAGTVATLSRFRPERWSEVGRAARRTLRRQSVRAFLFGKALPYGIIVILASIGVLFGFPITQMVIVAVAVGMVLRVAFSLLDRTIVTLVSTESEPRTATQVDVGIGTIETRDGRTIYVAREDSRHLAWPDADQLVDQVLADVESMFQDGHPLPSVQQEYYQRMRDTGQTDAEQALKAHRLKARGTLERLAQSDDPDIERVEAELAERFDPRVIEMAKRRAMYQEGTVSKDDHQYRYHGSD